MRNINLAPLARLLPLVVALCASALGQKFQVLHAFAGAPSDGITPATPLLLDGQGHLFGITALGGADITGCNPYGCGAAFELSKGFGRWKENVLYSFSSVSGSLGFEGSLVTDSAGNIYGTQLFGGDPSCNCGAVYQLTNSGGAWTENILHNFLGGVSDGAFSYSGLVRDSAGNLYGTTQSGGVNRSYGTVFELTPNADGSWGYSVIYYFNANVYLDGSYPWGPLTIDSLGNLYGTTQGGGNFGLGTVFKLSPSGGTWTETILFNFTLDYGSSPSPTGVVADATGSLYGTTINGGAYAVGTVYKLTPSIGFWNRTILHTFTGSSDGAFPYGVPTIDSSGTLYGTSDYGGSFGYGNVYKLARVSGKWKETILHEFTNGTDGANPFPGVILDSQGNLYGVAGQGGAHGFGVAFEITP